MAEFNININSQDFFVNNILTQSTDCSTIYEYSVIANNAESITITLTGNHTNETYTLNGVTTSFTDTVTLAYNTSLTVRFSLPNSGISGYFNNATLSIENTDTLSSITTYNYYVERENDNIICESLAGLDSFVSNVELTGNLLTFTGVESAFNGVIDLSTLSDTNDYADSLTYDNVSGLLTLGRTGALPDLTAVITPPFVEGLATTQVIELGDIGTDTIEDGFNAHTFIGTEDPVQDQLDGYVLINCVQNGLATQYLFIGVGGAYGTTGVLTAVPEDFTLIETTDLYYDVWRDTGGVNKAFSYTQAIRHGGEVRANSFVVEDADDGGIIKNRRFGDLLVEGYTNLILRSANPNNSLVTVTSNGVITAYDNDRERYNLRASRDYSSTVVFAGARKTLVGIGIEDKVFLNDATQSTNMDYAALYINPNIVAGSEADKIFSIYSYTGNVELNDGNIKFGKYGLNNVTGTPAFNLAVDAAGNVIETSIAENLTWQHASSTFGGSSDVTENLIPGQATSFTTAVVHNGPIMSPEMVTNSIKNKGFAGLDLIGTGAGSSVYSVRLRGSNPNNGNVEIGLSTSDINTYNPVSEGRKNTVALVRSFKPTVGATLTSAGDFQFTGVYANNPINFDTYVEDENSYYAAFESNPIITGTHLVANPDKIFALRGKGRLRLTDYGLGNVTGTALYNIAVDSTGKFIESGLNGSVTTKTTTYTAQNNEIILCDATSGGFTINLPLAASSTNFSIYLKKIDSTGNIITIDGNGTETIDGSLTQTFTTQYESIQIICNGTEWFIIG